MLASQNAKKILCVSGENVVAGCALLSRRIGLVDNSRQTNFLANAYSALPAQIGVIGHARANRFDPVDQSIRDFECFG